MNRIGRTLALTLSLAALLIVPVGALAGDPQSSDQHGAGARLNILTYNIYQGSELQAVLRSTTVPQLLSAVAMDFGHVLANNFSARAAQIALEVASAHPAVIGLQEVALWQTTPISKTCPSTTGQTLDYLQMLQTALVANGLNYTTLVVRSNFAVQSPGLFPCGLVNVRLTDRSAILVRTSDLANGQLSVANIQSQTFVHNFQIVFFGSTIVLYGGWTSVDLSFHGTTVRFISTHLDGFSPAVRLAQANEILAGPANVALPVILSGDLNSVSTDPTYAALVAAGFGDAWNQTNPNDSGYTCCQTIQNGVTVDVINNPASALSERVDYVLTLGALQADKTKLVGDDPSSMTASGFWPSDHAGLAAAITVY
ncbi:MAG: endonuclease/exonuclease/phosphatase family protein [Thermoplasmata archaeon]|nr:endonuclease/exonuclease/phosphatase family protein [Thermoplasmata archaeon]